MEGEISFDGLGHETKRLIQRMPDDVVLTLVAFASNELLSRKIHNKTL